MNRESESDSRAHGNTSHNRLMNLEVIEQRLQIASQRPNRELVLWSKFTLAMATEVGVNDAQRFLGNACALRSKESSRLPNVSTNSVLKHDHRM
jgi:hypothetical protein